MSYEKILQHPLKTGWVSLGRERRGSDTLLHFEVELDIDYPAPVIFEQLILALSDTAKSWIWPHEYEYSPAPPAGGLREGCTFDMTYKVPRFDRPEIPAKAVTYTYTLAQYRPGDCLFEYRSVDHPLSGGAVVRTIARGENRCRLSWKGAYRQDREEEVVVQSLARYIPFFYGKVEECIAAGPPR